MVPNDDHHDDNGDKVKKTISQKRPPVQLRYRSGAYAAKGDDEQDVEHS